MRLNNITVNYAKRSCLRRLDIAFCETGLYKITGENGTGKTTLLKVIGGHARHSGKILDQGIILKAQQRRRLFSSSLSYLAYLGSVKSKRMAEAIESLTKIDDIDLSLFNDYLKILQIDHLWNCLLIDLSMGEKKRLLTATTLARKSQVFLLDEPLASLDGESAKKCKALLERLATSTLIIYTSHDEIPLSLGEIEIRLGAEIKLAAPKTSSSKLISKWKRSTKATLDFINEKSSKRIPWLLQLFLFLTLAVTSIFSNGVLNYLFLPSAIKNLDSSLYTFKTNFKDGALNSKLISSLDDSSEYLDYFFTIYEMKFEYNSTPMNLSAIDEKIRNRLLFLPAEDLRAEHVPGSFYMGKAFYDYLNSKKSYFIKYGVSNEFFDLFKFCSLPYGGLAGTDAFAVYLHQEDMFAHEGRAFKERYYNKTKYKLDGTVFDRTLEPYEALVPYKSGTAAVIPSSVQVFNSHLNVVGYFIEESSTRVMISDNYDLTSGYKTSISNYFTPHIFLIRSDIQKNPYSYGLLRLKEKETFAYRESISTKFIVSIVTISTMMALAIFILATDLYLLRKSRRSRFIAIQALGKKSQIFMALCYRSIYTLLIYLVISPILLLLSLNSFLFTAMMILILLISIFFELMTFSESYPLERNQDA